MSKKSHKSCLVTLLIGVLLLVIGSGYLAFYQENKTLETARMLDGKVRDPAWRDQFEKDFKPAFDQVIQGDQATSFERQAALEPLLKQRFPDMSLFLFTRDGDEYAAKLFFGRACLAYVTADPETHPHFIPSHQKVFSSYPRFFVLWHEWD